MKEIDTLLTQVLMSADDARTRQGVRGFPWLSVNSSLSCPRRRSWSLTSSSRTVSFTFAETSGAGTAAAGIWEPYADLTADADGALVHPRCQVFFCLFRPFQLFLIWLAGKVLEVGDSILLGG